MGLMNLLFGSGAGGLAQAGKTVKDVAEVFVPNETRKMELSAEAYRAALDEAKAEMSQSLPGAYEQFMNGLNRLPRPMLAFGTIGLFVYAMVDPEAFARRMVGLDYVPDPLWWLMTAIVGFYFGAREAYYFRQRPPAAPRALPGPPGEPPAAASPAVAPDANPARDALLRGSQREHGGRDR